MSPWLSTAVQPYPMARVSSAQWLVGFPLKMTSQGDDWGYHHLWLAQIKLINVDRCSPMFCLALTYRGLILSSGPSHCNDARRHHPMGQGTWVCHHPWLCPLDRCDAAAAPCNHPASHCARRGLHLHLFGKVKCGGDHLLLGMILAALSHHRNPREPLEPCTSKGPQIREAL